MTLLPRNAPGNTPKIVPNSSSGYCIILICQNRDEIGMIGNVTGTVTGRKGPCLNHSLRDGRTCSILLVPVGRYMTLATGSGSAGDELFQSHR